MEKKILATAVSLAMGLEFFCGSTVLADASRFYKLPSETVQESKEWVPYDDSSRIGNDDDADADAEDDGDVVFNPYVFRADGNNGVSASVVVDPEYSESVGTADRFDDASNSTVIVIGDLIPGVVNYTDMNTTVTNSTGMGIPINSSEFSFAVEGPDLVYDGDPICPNITIVNTTSSDYLLYDDDYTVNFINNTNAGTATYTVHGKGKYTGEYNGTFEIAPVKFDADFTSIEIGNDNNLTYTGDEVTLNNSAVWYNEISLIKDTDFEFSYLNNTNVGNATVIATGKGNYEGSVNATFEIEPAMVAAYTTVSGLNDTYEYTGEPIEPDVDIVYQSETGNRTLVNGTDYELQYSSNYSIGRATLTVLFKGNFIGAQLKFFDIVPASLEHDTTIEVDETYDNVYRGGIECCPSVTVTHNGVTLNSTDYDVAFFNNTDAGSAVVEVTGKGNYNGTASQSFTIHPMSMYNTTVELGYNTTSYDGTNKTPSVTVTFGGDTTLQEGVDYEVSYLNNTDAGQATINITGKGNFDESVIKTFQIEQGSLSLNTSISVYAPVDKFQGTPLTANISVYNQGRKLINGTDYDVSYLNNTEAGIALVTVTGKGNYNGTANSSFTIDPQSISSSIVNVNLSDTSFAFNGSEVRPVVTVTINGITLEEGKHYSLNYTANDAPGTGRVIVRGIGSLTGSVTKEFEIIQLNEYTITFDGNGGGGSMDPITVTEGDPFTVPECGFDAPVGKTFDDWDIAPAGSNMTVTENMTFTAQWKEIIYPVITGNDTWTEGDANLTVEFDAPIGKFLYAECAGENLTEGVDFILTEGSTIITLTEDFLKSLTAGTYTLTAHFTDGKSEWTFKVLAHKDKGGEDKESDDSPQTSQPMSSAVFAGATVMAVAALGGMAYIAWDEIKKRYNR